MSSNYSSVRKQNQANTEQAATKIKFSTHFSNLPDIFIEGVKFIVLQASPFEHIYHCCLNAAKKETRQYNIHK